MQVLKLSPGTPADRAIQQPNVLIMTTRTIPPGVRGRFSRGRCTLVYILEGHVREDGLVRGPGSVHCHPEGDWLAESGSETLRTFGVTFDEGYLKQMLADGSVGPTLDLEGERARQIAVAMLIEFRRRDVSSVLSLQCLFLEMLSQVDKSGKSVDIRMPAWLRNARDLLEDCPSGVFSLSEIAAKCGIHPSHLARSFRQRFGMTLGEYHRRIKLDLALRLLDASDAPIGEVATVAGYADHAHFTRTVQNWTGRSPREIRRGFIPQS